MHGAQHVATESVRHQALTSARRFPGSFRAHGLFPISSMRGPPIAKGLCHGCATLYFAFPVSPGGF